MIERFTFPKTDVGLEGALSLTLSLRRAGFKTHVTEEVIGRTPVYKLHARPAARLSRKERGLWTR